MWYFPILFNNQIKYINKKNKRNYSLNLLPTLEIKDNYIISIITFFSFFL